MPDCCFLSADTGLPLLALAEPWDSRGDSDTPLVTLSVCVHERGAQTRNEGANVAVVRRRMAGPLGPPELPTHRASHQLP